MQHSVEIVAWVDVAPTPERIRWAKEAGLAGLNVMIHGDSTDRTAGPFAVHRWVEPTLAAIADAGLDVELTAWAQPHAAYLDAACEWLVGAALRHGARCVWWDAEEPWTQARGGLSPQAAADRIDLAGAREGVTGIGYAPRSLDPLLARADVVAPQAYATTRPGSLSHRGIAGVLEGWRRRAPSAQLEPALAAYSQPSDAGLAQAWVAAGRPSRIQVWALRHLRAAQLDALAGALAGS